MNSEQLFINLYGCDKQADPVFKDVVFRAKGGYKTEIDNLRAWVFVAHIECLDNKPTELDGVFSSNSERTNTVLCVKSNLDDESTEFWEFTGSIPPYYCSAIDAYAVKHNIPELVERLDIDNALIDTTKKPDSYYKALCIYFIEHLATNKQKQDILGFYGSDFDNLATVDYYDIAADYGMGV